jgi:hypothetical protein
MVPEPITATFIDAEKESWDGKCRPTRPAGYKATATVQTPFCLGGQEDFLKRIILLVTPPVQAPRGDISGKHFPFTLILSSMWSNLYIIAVILIIIWALGFFGVLGCRYRWQQP